MSDPLFVFSLLTVFWAGLLAIQSVKAQSSFTNVYPLLADVEIAGGTIIAVGDGMLVKKGNGNWNVARLDVTNRFTSITSGHLGFMAVTENGHFAVSKDGEQWNVLRPAALFPDESLATRFEELLYYDGIYFSVSGFIARSTNGKDWQVLTRAAPSRVFRHLIVNGTELLALSSDGRVAVSKDGGKVWEMRTISENMGLLSGAFFQGRYYAVNTAQEYYSSADGFTWESHGTLKVANFLVAEGTMLAAGVGGIVYSTTNGLTWTSYATARTNYIHALKKADNRFFCVGVSRTFMESVDAVNWTEVIPGGPTADDLLRGAGNLHNSLIMGRNGNLFSCEPDGQWIRYYGLTTNAVFDVAASPSGFAVSGAKGTVFLSSDLENWQIVQTPTEQSVYSISSANGIWFAGGLGFITSPLKPDQWQLSQVHPNLLVNRVAFGNDRYVAVASRVSFGGGASGGSGLNLILDQLPTALVSDDGSNWRAGATIGDPAGVAFGNGWFVAVGQRVYRSADGEHWENTSPVNDPLSAVAFINGNFYLSGYPGVLFTSREGRDWHTIPSAAGLRTRYVFSNGSDIMVLGDGATFTKSPIDIYLRHQQGSDGARFLLYGGPHQNFILQHSTDLNTWNNFQTVTGAQNPIELDLNPSAPQNFYRVKAD